VTTINNDVKKQRRKGKKILRKDSVKVHKQVEKHENDIKKVTESKKILKSERV
jgi:hypothetical protein